MQMSIDRDRKLAICSQQRAALAVHILRPQRRSWLLLLQDEPPPQIDSPRTHVVLARTMHRSSHRQKDPAKIMTPASPFHLGPRSRTWDPSVYEAFWDLLFSSRLVVLALGVLEKI